MSPSTAGVALALVAGLSSVLFGPWPALELWPWVDEWTPAAWARVRSVASLVVVLSLCVKLRVWLAVPMSFLAAIGLGVATLAEDVKRHWPESLYGDVQRVEGTVLGAPKRFGDRIQFDIRVDTLHAADASAAPPVVPRRVRVTSAADIAPVKSAERW